MENARGSLFSAALSHDSPRGQCRINQISTLRVRKSDSCVRNWLVDRAGDSVNELVRHSRRCERLATHRHRIYGDYTGAHVYTALSALWKAEVFYRWDIGVEIHRWREEFSLTCKLFRTKRGSGFLFVLFFFFFHWLFIWGIDVSLCNISLYFEKN